MTEHTLTAAEIEALIAARHREPRSVLGYHEYPRAGDAPLCIVRAHEPDAVEVALYWEDERPDAARPLATLHPAGLSVWVKKFVRADGKMIQLVPMAHVGDAAFYQKLTQSFPTNALILMEGVTDEQQRLTNKISYKRMATTLGLTEQKEEFQPKPQQVVRADVDIAEFSPGTIALLNLVMRVHSKGLDPATLQELIQYPVTPELQAQLIADLVTKRNAHLLGEIREHLAESDLLIVPWGAAHMPGIASEIQKSGFRLMATNEYTVIHFGSAGKQGKTARP